MTSRLARTAAALAIAASACHRSAPGPAPAARHAYDVSGEVRDGDTLAPVAGADVEVATDSGISVRSRTDAAGRFSVSLGAPIRGYSLGGGAANEPVQRIVVKARKEHRCAVAAYPPPDVARDTVQLVLVPCDRLKPAYE